MSDLIEEKDVTAVNLAIELERAVIGYTLENDKSIYVTEDGWFPHWVQVYKGSGCVVFKTHSYFKKSTSQLHRMQLCNELNSQFCLITAYVEGNRLNIDYALNFRGGLLRETFIRVCRQFSSNIERGLDKVDAVNDYVLPPGETEPEDESHP
ncbi:MAG: YbjN domain-containing protein [Rhodoferax sp.]|nr:YbjN domain-containing protein [Rhodoferax sp.]